ncbi:MAG: hypothetical protein QGF46_05915 [Planctomycetota bacterium]|jgi:hypothetical protein|nr:hypothetical protein [Planctomycetota bacterium]
MPSQPLAPAIKKWRVAQIAFGGVGIAIASLLLLAPSIGLHAFWNCLIPVAPALFVFLPGLWRNICPLASVALLPIHTSISKRRRLSTASVSTIQRLSVIALLLIIPLRHPLFNLSAPATLGVIISCLVIAFVFGLNSEWKSGWCSAACPINHVEKLYGCQAATTFNNAHCYTCARCIEPCPDSTANNHNLYPGLPIQRTQNGLFMSGFFPGYIWGWFQVADSANGENLLPSYLWCIVGGLASLAAFMIARKKFPRLSEFSLSKLSAVAAVSTYYWYRLPALIGYTKFRNDGVLIDLSDSLPEFTPYFLKSATTLLFVWWFLLRPTKYRSWLQRPIVQK